MINSGFRITRGQDAVGCTIGGVTILTGGSVVDAPRGGFAVHAGSVCFYGVFCEELVVCCKDEIFMAVATGVGHIQGVNGRPLVRRFEDLVSAMAIGTCGEIAVQLDSQYAVLYVDFGLLIVAATAVYPFEWILMRA
jgi:hypothetical protein